MARKPKAKAIPELLHREAAGLKSRRPPRSRRPGNNPEVAHRLWNRRHHRSGCPVSTALDLLGDRWSLLLVRDMMVRGYRTFREFQRSGERIATNILSDRLQKLEANGIVGREPAVQDGRSTHYRLTAKGIALAPVLLEILIWGAHHEQTDAPCDAIAGMEQHRAAWLAETYRRWERRDPTPLIPPFASSMKSTSNSPKGKSRR